MWTITKNGTYSAVQDRENEDLNHVRCWVREDADWLCDWYADWLGTQGSTGLLVEALGQPWPEAVITTYEGSDYPWRVIMPNAAWALFCYEAALAVDYPKFKPAVESKVDRHDAYLAVFFALARLEFEDPEGRDRPYMGLLGEREPEYGQFAWDEYDDWERTS